MSAPLRFVIRFHETRIVKNMIFVLQSVKSQKGFYPHLTTAESASIVSRVIR